MTAARWAVRCRGTCPGCKQTVETDAPEGRTTWRGNCPGCGHKMIARRVPGQNPLLEDDKPSSSSPPAENPAGVRKVTRYRDQPVPEGFARPDDDRGAAGRPARVRPRA